MRHFKTPLIVTGITLLVAIMAGIVMVTSIHKAKLSDREKKARVELLGGGMGIGVLMITFPFWILAAGKVGKERRAAREAQRQTKSGGE